MIMMHATTAVRDSFLFKLSAGTVLLGCLCLNSGCRQIPRRDTSPTPLPAPSTDASGAAEWNAPQLTPVPMPSSGAPPMPPAEEGDLPPLPGVSANRRPQTSAGFSQPYEALNDTLITPTGNDEAAGPGLVQTDDQHPLLISPALNPLPVIARPAPAPGLVPLRDDDDEESAVIEFDLPRFLAELHSGSATPETTTTGPALLDSPKIQMPADILPPAAVELSQNSGLPRPVAAAVPPATASGPFTVPDWTASGIPFDMVITPGPNASKWSRSPASTVVEQPASGAPRRLTSAGVDWEPRRIE